MAGLPWIKVWTAIASHPKVQRLERELGIEDALGVVVRLWCWTADYHPDGEIPESDAAALERFMLCDLTLPESVTRNAPVTLACVTCGLLDSIPGGFRVHDWHEMQTVHVEAEERRRVQARERQARFRSRRNVTGERDVTRDVTRDSVTEKEKEKEKEIREERSTRASLSAFEQGARDRAEPLPPASAEYPDLAALLEAVQAFGGVQLTWPRDRTVRGSMNSDATHAREAGRWDEVVGAVVQAHGEDPHPSAGWYARALHRAARVAAPGRVNGKGLELPAEWVSGLPEPDQGRAREEWAALRASVERAAYPDARERLVREALEGFMARGVSP